MKLIAQSVLVIKLWKCLAGPQLAKSSSDPLARENYVEIRTSFSTGLVE